MRKGVLTRTILAIVASMGIGTGGAAEAAGHPQLPDFSGAWENLSGIHLDALSTESPDPVAKALFQASDPPYNAEWEARWDKIKASFARGEPINDPTAACVWPGVPRIIWNPYPKEIVIADDGKLIVFLEEYMSQIRRVYADGRGHPEDPDPSFNGHTIGHWEGQTLVMDTVGLRGDTMFQNTGMPHSDALQVKERWYLMKDKPDYMRVDITLIDPVAFTRPWETTRVYKRHRDWSLIDYVCEENNREVIVDGVTKNVGH